MSSQARAFQEAEADDSAACPERSQAGSEGKDTFNDKQSQIAERKTGGEQGPGDRSKDSEHLPARVMGAHESRGQVAPRAAAAPTRRPPLVDAAGRRPPPPSRTNWTRLVHPSVLTGHV